ncbi:NADPH:quinone reductase [Rhodococcus sp. SORGH_AS_0301]|uniref:NADPH:quinone reductase n=1 Tax=Rhodococcus sp. SORGH_AS_0301 TaxID=3041780 RepID=UPI0027833EE4|nr:NADPH:quinone reductase [Rhodococcus sp. SORGH_AS_0301]MDQ1179091.1 NADPH:quinone reductase-like Zn-dependent oxidoreductase [Rhodococcus sp. SORGH_AS_0301]
MKAIVYTETGAPSVLTAVDRDIVEPGVGEVRVRLVVAGVNPTDWKSRTGAGPGQKPAFDEVVPGQDGAGVVDAVGPEVEGIATGDRVWLLLAQHERPTGTAQEFTVVPADRVVRLPENADFDLGASLGVPAVTAHRALTVSEDGPSRLHPGALDGKTVLVAGGAGAVGHAAIQLARWAGATVITTVSGPEKAGLATAARAHHIVNYKSGDAVARIRELAPHGVDIIVEVAPAQERGARCRRRRTPRVGGDLREQRRRRGLHRHPPEHGRQHPVPVRAAVHRGNRRSRGREARRDRGCSGRCTSGR